VTSQVRRAAPFIPNDEWFVLRVLTFLTGALLLVVASTGLLSEKLFAAPTTTKYLVTVAASAMLVLIATERAPVRLVVFFGVLTVPLSFVFSFAGLQPSPLIAVDLLALLMALPQRLKSHARLAKMAPAYALLLLPGILGSNDPGYYFVWVGVTLGTGWLAYVVARGVGGTQLIVAGLTLVAVAEGALAIYEFKTGTQFNLYGSALNNTLLLLIWRFLSSRRHLAGSDRPWSAALSLLADHCRVRRDLDQPMAGSAHRVGRGDHHPGTRALP
jgi:hypothetical protein